jgi:hypothetical protein
MIALYGLTLMQGSHRFTKPLEVIIMEMHTVKNNKFTRIQFQLSNFCNANDHCGHPYMSSIGSALVVIIEIRLFRVPQRDMDTIEVTS